MSSPIRSYKAACCSSTTSARASLHPDEQLFIAFHAESFAVLYPFLQVSVARFPSFNFVHKLVKDERVVGLAEP